MSDEELEEVARPTRPPDRTGAIVLMAVLLVFALGVAVGYFIALGTT